MSRIADDELAIALATSGHVDGVIVDVPVFAAIGFVNAALDAGVAVPMLVISHTPEIVRRTFRSVGAARASDVSDLVTTVDLMLARHAVEHAREVESATA